jgi:hypothetical protein
MQKRLTNRDAIIDPLRALIFQSDVRRSRMTLHIRSQWHCEVTGWAKRVDRKLEPNQMREIIRRWRLDHLQEGHGRPSGT